MEWIQKPSDLGITTKACIVYKEPCVVVKPHCAVVSCGKWSCKKYYQSCKTKIYPTSK